MSLRTKMQTPQYDSDNATRFIDCIHIGRAMLDQFFCPEEELFKTGLIQTITRMLCSGEGASCNA